MLAGRVIVVTGGATGIGWGIARAVTENGARAAIIQKDRDQAEAAAAKLQGARGFDADISDPRQVATMVEEVASAFGRIDALVNNASVTGPLALGPFLRTPPEDVDRIVDVNLKGAIWCSQAVARHMVASARPGVILHISSVGAFAAQELASIYCATKAGQASLAQSMALELAPYGIRVNAIAPGDIDTDTNANISTDLKAAGASGQFLRRTPLGRRGAPADVAEAAVFLLSDRSSFITGAVLRVDGGFLAY